MLADQGHLRPHDGVRRGVDGQWIPAGQVKGLFPAGAVTAAQPIPLRMVQPPKPPAGGGGPRPPGADPFSLVVDADSLAPGHTPKVRRRQPKHGLGMEQQEEEKKKLMLVLGLLGLLVVLAAAFVLVLVYSGNPSSDAEKAKGIAAKPADEKKPEPSKPRSEKPAAELTKKAEKAEPVPPKPEPAPSKLEPGPSESAKRAPSVAEVSADDKWHDAAKSPIERGDVTIRVVSALVGTPRLVRPQAPDAKPMQEFLWITVELKNGGATKVQYASWSGRGPAGANVSLSDDLGRPCLAAAFPSGYVVEGQIARPTPVDPSGAIRDVLPFRKPVDLGTLKYLRLQLPAPAFGGKGTLNFEIPREMLTEAPPLVLPKPAAQPAPQPAAPGLKPSGGNQPKGSSDDPPPLRLDDVEEFR